MCLFPFLLLRLYLTITFSFSSSSSPYENRFLLKPLSSTLPLSRETDRILFDGFSLPAPSGGKNNKRQPIPTFVSILDLPTTFLFLGITDGYSVPMEINPSRSLLSTNPVGYCDGGGRGSGKAGDREHRTPGEERGEVIPDEEVREKEGRRRRVG
jgi:hypothetical protein